ncbi:HAD-IIB family hydrolase [Treponema sp.]
MKPILKMTVMQARNVEYVLMDIDDTLTRDGKLLASSYTALWQLKEAGLHVIPVTGRPAGWCDLIAREWPVDGVVGENGALAFWEEASEDSAASESPAHKPSPTKRLPVLKQFFHPKAIRNNHPVIERVREAALGQISGLRVAKDQFARLYDLALDFAEEDPVLPLSTAQKVKEIAEAEGAIAKVSSIHVNVWMGSYDKLSMAELFLSSCFGYDPSRDLEKVLFVGDSPNDEPMFAQFPLACAVANIHRYKGLIKKLPVFVSEAECGDGFAEIASILLKRRNQSL